MTSSLLPAITLTNPLNQDSAPSPAQSPIKEPQNFYQSPADFASASSRQSGGTGSPGTGRPATPSSTTKTPASSRSSQQNSGGGGTSGRQDRSPTSHGSSNDRTSPRGNLLRKLSQHASPTRRRSRDETQTKSLDDRPSFGGPVRRPQHDTQVPESEQASMDPLSQHIIDRTNAGAPPLQQSGGSSSRPTTSDGSSLRPNDDDRTRRSSPARSINEPSDISRTNTHESIDAHRDLRKGIKAVSFISRLMGGQKKKESSDNGMAEESASNDGRLEGNDAEVFAGSTDNLSFNPRQSQPPPYIKMLSKNKKRRDFDRVFLAQELEAGRGGRSLQRNGSGGNKLRRKSTVTRQSDTVWAMEFSKDGKYLAAAGADGIVRVWQVLSSPEDREKLEADESRDYQARGAASIRAEHVSAPVFLSKPVREYEAHTSTVLDLSWGKNNFLLSSSMDKTVRLWHVSRAECLCTFKHHDFVPSISFHPKDDRFFLAGSLDSKLRLWSIPDKAVAYTVQVPDMITAVAFTPDGKSAMAGCAGGLCMFYEAEGLKYQTQIHVKSTRGQNARGSKITGIQSRHSRSGDLKVLITSNDSRVRLYNFRDKSLELKFRGNVNNSSQIRASFSDCGNYVVCGSEDRKAYIWSVGMEDGERRDRRPVEMFEAHNTVTTAVCMAPTKTKFNLGRSDDPVYDLCNPPPSKQSNGNERADSRTSSGSPADEERRPSIPPDHGGQRLDKTMDSPAYIARSSHDEGNIIVTADLSGRIKIFRQDCAWSRRRADDGDRSSLFSKRTGGRNSRTGSITTKASRTSLRDARMSMSSLAPSEKIMSWRQGVASTPTVDQIAPLSKRPTQSNSDQRVDSRKASLPDTSKPSHLSGKDTPDSTDNEPPLLNDSTEDNPLLIKGGKSYTFWDTTGWRARAEKMHKAHEAYVNARPPLDTVQSVNSLAPSVTDQDSGRLSPAPPDLHRRTSGLSKLSQLSDERSASGTEDEFSDAPEERAKHQ